MKATSPVVATPYRTRFPLSAISWLIKAWAGPAPIIFALESSGTYGYSYGLQREGKEKKGKGKEGRGEKKKGKERKGRAESIVYYGPTILHSADMLGLS